jgi:2,4-dienoyl-CoA reductase-like NADH-dependent reductase (Old Yellow Enzyme family)
MLSLFDPVEVGAIKAKNRIFMAPRSEVLSRGFATGGFWRKPAIDLCAEKTKRNRTRGMVAVSGYPRAED